MENLRKQKIEDCNLLSEIEKIQKAKIKKQKNTLKRMFDELYSITY